MSAAVVWLLAAASTALLVASGYALAGARFRSRTRALRRKTQQHQASLDARPEDPFGELQVITDQLRRIDLRLGSAEQVAGLPRASASSSGPSLATPAPAGGPTAELEQDLDLFKREVYSKTQRIDELVEEKQKLAEKIVSLETKLAEAEARATAAVEDAAQGQAGREPVDTEGSMALLDVLQQESDDLRTQVADRDRLIETLKKGDQTGLVHELQRIRAELVERNQEVSGMTAKLARLEERLDQQTARGGALEQEKEALAAKALESAAQLRQANEKIYALEQAAPGSSRPPTSTAPMPAPPRVPMPRPQVTPMAGSPSGVTPPPRVPPPSRTPPPRTPPPPRREGSIFPPPRDRRGPKR